MRGLLLLLGLAGGVVIVRRILPTGLREGFSQLPGTAMKWMMGHMPDE